MSPGELRFIEPYLDKVCFMCAKKGQWRRSKKNLCCTNCKTEFAIMPDGSLAVASRPHVAAATA